MHSLTQFGYFSTHLIFCVKQPRNMLKSLEVTSGKKGRFIEMTIIDPFLMHEFNFSNIWFVSLKNALFMKLWINSYSWIISYSFFTIITNTYFVVPNNDFFGIEHEKYPNCVRLCTVVSVIDDLFVTVCRNTLYLYNCDISSL